MYITKEPTVLTSAFRVNPQLQQDYLLWQSELSCAFTSFDGFVSLEFSHHPDQKAAVVQRFTSTEKAQEWKNSSAYLSLIEKLKPLLAEKNITETVEKETALKCGVTEVIITEVEPKNQEAFRVWCAKIHEAEASFKGFRGVYIQSPKTPQSRYWITLIQFESSSALDRWLASNERNNLLKEATPLVCSMECNRIASPFAGWFTSIAKSEEIPSVWQQTMVVLLVLFPIVMMEIKFLTPYTQSLNLSVATFIGNAISVTLISFPFMPLVLPLLNWWLFPKSVNTKRTLLWGTLLLLLLYAIEVFLFS